MPKDYSIGYKIKADASGYKKAMVEMNQATQSFSRNIKDLGRTLIAGVGIRELVRFSGESMKLAAAAEGVRTAFMRIGDAKKTLEDIRKATRGVIDDEELMGLALKAQNFNIPLKNLAQMLEFSSNRALTTGNSITEFANKFVEGVGRRMPKSLIQLQISAADAKAMFSHEGLGGVLEYTNGELIKMGEVMDTSQVRYQSFGASIDNLKQSWGDFLNNTELVKKSVTGIANVLQDIANRGILRAIFESKGETERHLAENAKWDTDRYGNLLSSKPGSESIIVKPVQDLGLLKKAADEAAKALERLKRENERVWSGSAMAEAGKYYTEFRRVTSIYAASKYQQLKGGGMARGGANLAGAPGTQEEIDRVNESLYEQSAIVENLSSTFENMFANIGDGFDSMIGAMLASLRKMISYLLAKAAVFGILTLLSGGTGAIAGFATKALGGKTLGGFMGFADGTNYAPGGLSLVGERGPELVNLPRGSQVIPMKKQMVEVRVSGKLHGRDIYLSGSRYVNVLDTTT